MEAKMRWKFDEEEWKDRLNKAFDKALEKWRLSVTDCSMEHQTTAAKKDVHEADIVREMGYAAKVFDGSLKRNLEVSEMGYAEKVFDGSPERVLEEDTYNFVKSSGAPIQWNVPTGTHPEFSPHITSHFNCYDKSGKGIDVGGYGEMGTNVWGSYKDGGSGGGPGQGRVRTLNIPRFDGKDPNGWVMSVERIGYVYRVSEDELLEAVEMVFVGDVLQWYQWENKRRPFRCWSDLKRVILRQYSSSRYQNFSGSYGGHGGVGEVKFVKGVGKLVVASLDDEVEVESQVFEGSPGRESTVKSQAPSPITGVSDSTILHHEFLLNLGGSGLSDHTFTTRRDGRNEMMPIQPEGDTSNLHGGQNVPGQGLSLSLSPQIPSGTQNFSLQYINHNSVASSLLSPNASISGENLTFRDDETSQSKQSKNTENMQPDFQGSGSDIMKGNVSPHVMSNSARNIPNFKYLKVAQQLLDEVVNVRQALKKHSSKKDLERFPKEVDEVAKNGALVPSVSPDVQDSTSYPSEFSSSEKQELQNHFPPQSKIDRRSGKELEEGPKFLKNSDGGFELSRRHWRPGILYGNHRNAVPFLRRTKVAFVADSSASIKTSQLSQFSASDLEDKIEHFREEKMVAAYELVEPHCELVAARLPNIESQKNCPIDLKEAIASVIFAAPRCSDVPELLDVKKHFTAKYGNELRPNCGIGRMLVEKLSAVAPDRQAKFTVLNAKAEEHNIKWNSNSFEEEETKPVNDLLNGPSTFEKASEMAVEAPDISISNVQATSNHDGHTKPLNFTEPNTVSLIDVRNVLLVNLGGSNTTGTSHYDLRPSGNETKVGSHSFTRDENYLRRQDWNMEFKDARSAAQAVAESAERASMAARAAVEFSRRENDSRQLSSESKNLINNSTRQERPGTHTSSKLPGEHFVDDKLLVLKEDVYLYQKKVLDRNCKTKENSSSKNSRSSKRKSQSDRQINAYNNDCLLENYFSQDQIDTNLNKEGSPDKQLLVPWTSENAASIVDAPDFIQQGCKTFSRRSSTELPPELSVFVKNRDDPSVGNHKDSAPQLTKAEGESSESSKEDYHPSLVSVLQVPLREDDVLSGPESFEQVSADLRVTINPGQVVYYVGLIATSYGGLCHKMRKPYSKGNICHCWEDAQMINNQVSHLSP